MRLRIRGPSGQATVTLDNTSPIESLKAHITEKTGLSSYTVKYGYPPKPLDLTTVSSSDPVSSIGIADGEQLTVAASETPPQQPLSSQHAAAPSVAAEPAAPPRQKQKDVSADPPEVPSEEHAGTVVLRVMPDDNSCLFRAVGTAVMGAMDTMTELRSAVAQAIQSQPDRFTAAILGKDSDDYCRWIMSENSWGGQIELMILSEQFEVEICSIDVQSLRVDKYNEGSRMRIIIVYSGIHYDAVALSPSDPPYTQSHNPPELDVKVFDAADEVILEKAFELCQVLQAKHYYTDTARFTVKCNVCGSKLTGEKGAIEHATRTGHYDFGEAQ